MIDMDTVNTVHDAATLMHENASRYAQTVMIDSAREAQPQQESEHTRDALEVKLDYNGRTWLHTNRFPWVDPQLIFGKETAEISGFRHDGTAHAQMKRALYRLFRSAQLL